MPKKIVPETSHILKTKTGKTAGIVSGDTLRRELYGSRHFLRHPPAISFDLHHLREAESMGARRVEVLDRETGTTFHADLRAFHVSALLIERGGHDLQAALPLQYWHTGEAPATVAKPAPKRPEAAQPALFSGWVQP